MLQFLRQRGDYIKKHIDWILFNNKKKILEYKNVVCEINNNCWHFNEDGNIINIIDLNKNIYQRESDDYILQVDFKKKKYYLTLRGKEKNTLFTMNLECASIEKEEDIHLKYKIDDEEKEILIHLLQ